MRVSFIIKSYGEYVRQNTLRNKKERLKYLKSYLDIVYKNKDKINLKKLKMGG